MVTSRRARLYRALIWTVGVLIITSIATATTLLLAADPVPDLWEPILRWLPDYLIPQSVADLPRVLLTILAAALLLVSVIRWIAAKSRPRPVLPPLTAEQIRALTMQPKEHFDALIAERSSRLQRWSTWGVVFGLLFTAGSLVYTARSLETSQEGQITDRYTKAIEQLGSKTIDVRLGAIYALERLAQDSERDLETITNVLAAYVREHAPKPKAKLPERPDTDVQAALTVLGTLYPRGESCLCDLGRVRIPGADLIGLHMDSWQLTSADLSKANLFRADLTIADLTAANLTGADLTGADLTEADLTGADLTEADLTKVNLTDALLTGADLRGADLTGANLRFPL